MLVERAKAYESASFKGLYNFINYLHNLKTSNGDLASAKIIGENDNVVRIMSIHKSKGLEFPVVILGCTGKQTNFMDLKDKVLLHKDMGIGVKYIDYDKQVEYNTLSKTAISNVMRIETLSEEMRVLYVALTRAKEKLIITGRTTSYSKLNECMDEEIKRYSLENDKINPILIKKYIKHLDWMILVSKYKKEKFEKLATINILPKKELFELFKKNSNNQKNNDSKNNVLEILNKASIANDRIKELDNIFSYNYPYSTDTLLPTKTSVTKLKELSNIGENVNIEDTKIENKNKENKENKEKTNKKSIKFETPKFIKNTDEEIITNAKKGTLIHLCMQKLDEKRIYELQDIQNLVDELLEKKIITKKERDLINVESIYKFTKSNIWDMLKTAQEVYKEKPFYTNVENDYYIKQERNKLQENKEEENKENKENKKEKNLSNKDQININNSKIIVQGIIDLYFIDKDDNLILLDYKSDYVAKGKEYELVNKYKVQLDIYKKALEEALNRKVSKVYIYSTHLNEEIEINYTNI